MLSGSQVDNLFSTVVTSALVATIVGALINAWIESWKAKRTNKLDALTIAVELEGYAIICSDKLADHDTAVSSEGHAGRLLASVPDLPQLSVVAGFFRPRKASLANRILVFPQEVHQADQNIAFWWDVVGDHDAMRNEAVAQVAKIGLKSLNLAGDIREEFMLPKRSLVFGKYDVRKVLEDLQPENSDV